MILFKTILKIFVNSPFYPHWLIFTIADRGNKKLLGQTRGQVLNVGSGADDRRIEIESNRQVSDYVTLDYPQWDKTWNECSQKSSIFGPFAQILFRNIDRKPDIWGDGYNLPFTDQTFDTVISQGVLEHISDSIAFLCEHHRVLKKNGLLLMTTPLIYQAHGGKPAGRDDYVRFTEYGLVNLLNKCGFKAIKIESYGNFGTALSQLINSFIIKKIYRLNVILIFICILPVSLIFFTVNIICRIIDLTGDDKCYTAGFFITARALKPNKIRKMESWKDNLRCPICHTKLVNIRKCSKCHTNFFNKKFNKCIYI